MTLAKIILTTSLSLLSLKNNPKTEGLVFNRNENEPYLMESIDATFSDSIEFSIDALVSTYDLDKNGDMDHIAAYKIIKRNPENIITDSTAFYLDVFDKKGNLIESYRDWNWDGILETKIEFNYEKENKSFI